jgi:molecular chaperone GrpE (heat shock protein)
MTEQLDDQETDKNEPAGGDAPNPAEGRSIEELQRDLAAVQDRLLRSAAEFDNYRKRIDRERRDLSSMRRASCCPSCCRSSTTSNVRC